MSISPESFELSEPELANQAGRDTQPERLTPYDEGRKAAADGLQLADNPHGRSTGLRKPWADGWKSYIADASKPPAESPAAKPEQTNGAGPKTHRISKDGVVPGLQQSLNIPGDPNLPSKRQQEVAAAYAESILSRVAASAINTLIESSIHEAAIARAATEAAAQQEFEARCARRREEMIAALGDLWPELEPYLNEADSDHFENGQGFVFRFRPDEIELRNFLIVVNGYRGGAAKVEAGYGTAAQNVPVAERARFIAFLAKARHDFFEERNKEEKQVTEKRQRVINEAAAALDSKDLYWRAKTTEAADAAFNQLIELAPGRKEKWEEFYADWLRWFAERQRQHLARKAWQAERDPVIERNCERLAEFQRIIDIPFEVYQVCYACVAADSESGERELETRTAWAFSQEPNAEGFYEVAVIPYKETTSIELRKYDHRVWVSAARTIRPSEEIVFVRHEFYDGRLGSGSHHVYTHPKVARAEVEAALAFEPLPEEPQFEGEPNGESEIPF